MSIPQSNLLQSQLEKQRRQVDVENYDITLGELVRMIENNEIIRAPEYQRKFRWRTEDESRLIESLFLGLPVPSVFVASNPDGTWEVVDGLQRLSTLIHFMSSSEVILSELGIDTGPLKLAHLKKLDKFNDYTFKDLPTPIRLHFSKRSLRVTALSDKSDPEIRFEVFERLNRGGVILTPQEVRACIYRGQFASLISKLAQNDVFRSLVKLQSSHQNDGTREELVLKFFAYLENGDAYDGSVTEFLNQYMHANKDKFDTRAGEKLFIEAITKIYSFTNGPLIRSGYSLTPLNQLEAILYGAGHIIKTKSNFATPQAGWLNDKQLVASSTKGTNSKTLFTKRNNRAIELLSGEKFSHE